MNQLSIEFFDNSFEERLSKRDELYRVTKNNISISNEVYASVIRPLQKRLHGSYVPSQGSDKQMYVFFDKSDAQQFSQELFLKATPADELNNKRIPFSSLVVRKDDFQEGLFHIHRDTPEADGSFPLIAYYDSRDLSLRSPLITREQEMNVRGDWQHLDNGSVFYFNTVADLVRFEECNLDKTVSEAYNNEVVKMRYDEKVAVELKQFASSALNRQQSSSPNIQARSNTSKGDKGEDADSRVVAGGATTPNQQKEVQLSLFPEEVMESLTITKATNNNGTEISNSTEHPNDEGQDKAVLSNDQPVHDASASQPVLRNGDFRVGERFEGGNTEHSRLQPSKGGQGSVGTTLRSAGPEGNGLPEGGSEGDDSVDHRLGNPSRMGADDKEYGHGGQPSADTAGDEPSVSAGPRPSLLADGVQPSAEIQQSTSGTDGSDGDDNDGIQPVLKKEEVETRNLNSWFASEHSVTIPKAGTAEALDTNIRALEVLASVLEEKRSCTTVEQDILAQYTGFGNNKIDFTNDSSYYASSLGEADSKRYSAVKSACQRIEKATNAMSSEELGKAGLSAPVTSSFLCSSLQDTLLTAFYTDGPIVRPIWDFAVQMGFKGGSILDPSTGNGRFESNMPKSLAENSSFTLIDKDPLSAMIAAQLHPGARTLNTAYEDYSKHNKHDFLVTNQPFSTIQVTDPEWVKEGRMQQPEYKAATSHLTSYFPVKGMENLNNGGLLAFITTSNFLDKRHYETARYLLAKEAEFVGAIRLPLETFANASVQSDILLFRKFNQGEQHLQHLEFIKSEEQLNPYFEGWNRYYDDAKESIESGAITDIKESPYYTYFQNDDRILYSVNEYFLKHPENIIGEKEKTYLNHNYRPAYSLKCSQEEIGAEVQKRINTIVAQYKEVHESKTVNIEHESPISCLVNEPAPSPALQRKIESFTKVKDSLNNLLKAYETDDPSQVDLRKDLNGSYLAFVRDYGHILDKKNDDLSGQPEFYKVAAIEKWKKVSVRSMKFVGKADIFTMNTIHPVTEDIKSTNPQDIINHSLHKYNRIDTGLMEEKLGSDWLEKADGLVFLNPTSKEFEPANYYLGGDVKTKLAEARQAATFDARFEKNVKALVGVQPERIPLTDISINFGANFVPSETYTAYVKEMVFRNKDLSDNSFSLTYNGSSIGSSYTFTIDHYLNSDKTLCFGPKKASDILEAALNDNHVTIYFPRKDKDEPQVQDEKSTFAANSKIDEIRDGFIAWLSQPRNVAYAQQIEDIYNEKYNRTAPIKYDANFVEPVGSTLQLRPHQRKAVARILTGADTLIDHPVGYGKTAVMIAAIQEQHRLGLSQKTLLLCMKANVKQVAQEYQKMYPSANILFPMEDDFTDSKRNILLNKIKTNKYDCVILTHDQYGRLEHSNEIQEEMIAQKMIEYKSAIDANPNKNSPTVKQLVREHVSLEEKMKVLMSKPHDPLAFEELGFDKLYVDESHQFKNLPFITTHNNVAGLGSPEGSTRAKNLLMGVRHIQHVNGGDRGVVFATGTPITNSIVEAYSIMQYLRPSMLKEHNHLSFDAWASQYAKKSEELEVQPSMTIKRVDRFREFINIPEVQKDYLSFADVPEAAEVKFDKPEENRVSCTVPSGGETHMNVLKALKQVTETGQSSYLGISLDDDKKSARSLVATTAGAKEAISTRFLGIEPTDMESDKATAIARKIAEKYKETDEHKGVQLVFSEIVGKGKAEVYEEKKKVEIEEIEEKKEKEEGKDEQKTEQNAEKKVEQKEEKKDKVSTADWENNTDENTRLDMIAALATSGAEVREYNLFADIKNKLVKEYGIPAAEIVSIRDYSPAKRKEFFDKANAGEVRVLMGSTQTLGTGVNVQARVVAMHHADVPWTPASVEQRTGRGVRQGNEVAKIYGNKVDNIFYLKEKSADAKKYNLLDIKQTFINGFRNGSNQERTLDTQEQSAESFFKDCLDETLGNPLYSERNKLKGRQEILLKERTAFNAQTLNLSSELTHYTTLLEANRKSEECWNNEAEYVLRNAPEKVDGKFPIDIIVNGKKYTAAKEAGDAIFRSTAIGNKTQVEAYGYQFNISKSLEVGKDNDRVITVMSRTADDGQCKLPFNDLLSSAKGKFTLGAATPGQTASAGNNTHIALAIRSIADGILVQGKKFQEQKILCQEQVKNLSADLDKRKVFPKGEELQRIENRIHEIDLQLNGQSSLDLKNWKQLSETWNSKEGNSEKLQLPASGKIDSLKEALFSKYLDMAHDEGTVRNSLDMQRFQFKRFEFNGQPVELAGPLTIEEERIKAVLPQEYLVKATPSQLDTDVQHLKEFFVSQAAVTIVGPLKETGENPHVAFVESPDFMTRDMASDSAQKDNELNRIVETNNPAVIIAGSDTEVFVHDFEKAQVDFFQVKSPFTEYVTDAFLNELQKEDFRLNTSLLISSYENQGTIADSLEKTLACSGWEKSVKGNSFPDNVTFTLVEKEGNNFDTVVIEKVSPSSDLLNYEVDIKDLQTLCKGRDEESPSHLPKEGQLGHTNSLEETYRAFIENPQNADVNYDSLGVNQFLSQFTLQSSIMEQERYMVSAFSGQMPGMAPVMPANKLFELLSSSVKDLAENHPSTDGRVHLLASESDHRIMPDPYYYVSEAEVFKGFSTKVTISEEEARKNPLAEAVSVWKHPSSSGPGNLDSDFFKMCSVAGISYQQELLSPKDLTIRLTNTAFAANCLLGEARLFKESYSYMRSDALRAELKFDQCAMNRMSDFNKLMPVAAVGLYRQVGRTGNDQLQIYPLGVKPTADKDGKALQLVATARFSTLESNDRQVTIYAPNILSDKKKVEFNLSTDTYIAGNRMDDADRKNLKLLGVNDRPISIISPSGCDYNLLLSARNQPAFPSILEIKAYDPSSLQIDVEKQKALDLTNQQIQEIKQGKSVPCQVDGKDAYLLLNPNEGVVAALAEKPAFAERVVAEAEIKESSYKDYSCNTDEDSTHKHKQSM